MTTTLAAFAHRNRLTVIRDKGDETEVIRGRTGDLYSYDDNDALLGVIVLPKPKHYRVWGHIRGKLERAGMTICQDGDHEGAATFSPGDPAQVKLALQAAGVSRRRRPSQAQLTALAECGVRFKPKQREAGEALCPPGSSKPTALAISPKNENVASGVGNTPERMPRWT
jgi:hypothetical protein